VEAVKVMTGGLKAGNSLEKTVTKARERLLDIYSEDEPMMKELSLMETGLKMNISVEVLFSDFGKKFPGDTLSGPAFSVILLLRIRLRHPAM